MSKKPVIELTVDDYNKFAGSDERTPEGDAEVTKMLGGDDWIIVEEPSTECIFIKTE